MWTRKELKERAKATLKINYWKTVLVALILALVSGGTNSGGAGGGGNFGDDFSSIFEGADTISVSTISAIIATVAVMFIIFFAIALALSVFVFNPLVVGCQRYFIRIRKEDVKLGEVAFAFSHSYMNIVKITFLEGLYIFLWTLLFIIPGIIKAYEYRMIPFILAENPDMDSKEVFARTKSMMDGDKWNAFVLDLSFLGWQLLGALTCCILSVFYVNPYVYLTNAELYVALKQKVDGPAVSSPSDQNGNVYAIDEEGSKNPYVQY